MAAVSEFDAASSDNLSAPPISSRAFLTFSSASLGLLTLPNSAVRLSILSLTDEAVTPVTITLQVALNPPSFVVIVIIASPVPSAFITPELLTLATLDISLE